MFRDIRGLRAAKLFLYAILLTAGGVFFPVLFAFIPALFVSEMRLQGVLPVSALFVGVCVIVGFLMDPMLGLSLLTTMGPLILILDYCMRTDRPVDKTLLAGAAIFLIGLGFVLYRSGALASIRSGEMLKQIYAVQKDVVRETELSAMEKNRMAIYLGGVLRRVFDLLPAFFLLTGLGVSYTSYRLGGRNMRAFGEKVICPGPFFLLRVPKMPVLAGAAALATAFLMNLLFDLGIQVFLLNGIVLLSGLLTFQGMSIVNFYLLRFVPSPILRGVIMILIPILPIGQMALSALGLLDQALDIRGIEGV